MIKNREPGRALITVTNHDSCLDDPLVIAGPLPLRYFRSELCRWSLGAKEVCHTNKNTTRFFCYGQVIPIIRGNGIYQKAMNFAIDELKKGAWVHIFPGTSLRPCHINDFVLYVYISNRGSSK